LLHPVCIQNTKYSLPTQEDLVNRKFVFTACLLALLAALTSYQLALAHTPITAGDYTIEIGWVNEPPIVGQQNAIVVNVSTTADDKSVEDVSGLTVAVSYGGEEKTLTLQPLDEDTPGQFVAPILPTIPGEYTVNLGGKLGTTDVNANVQPEEVQTADVLQFPSVIAEDQTTSSGITTWLIYLSLLIGVIALVLGVLALRKSR
jgi:hypothetical protein